MDLADTRANRLRILFCGNLFQPKDFGGSRYLVEIASRLSDRHELRVVTARLDGADASPNLKFLTYSVSRRTSVHTFVSNVINGGKTILRAIRLDRPEVLIFNSYEQAFGFFLLSLSSARPRVPSVFIYHSRFNSVAVERLSHAPRPFRILHHAASAFLRVIERYVLKNATTIVAVSPFSRAQIAKSVNESDPQNVVVIPTGVDTSSFQPGDKRTARTKVGLPLESLVLVVVGRLEPVKRFDIAILALGFIHARKLPMPILMIIGEGSERERLENLANDVGVSRFVRFEGFRTGEELLARLHAADIQLCTSEYENWSLALLEGLACGIPVLGVPTGGTPALLASVDKCLILKGDRIQDIVDGIESLSENPMLRSELGRKGRRVVTSRFDWSLVVTMIERELLTMARPRFEGTGVARDAADASIDSSSSSSRDGKNA